MPRKEPSPYTFVVVPRPLSSSIDRKMEENRKRKTVRVKEHMRSKHRLPDYLRLPALLRTIERIARVAEEVGVTERDERMAESASKLLLSAVKIKRKPKVTDKAKATVPA